MTEFFDQLQTFSERVFYSLGFAKRISPWHGDAFSGGKPSGAILHFTAGSSIIRALRWFMIPEHEAKSSAHVVVADGWPEKWLEFSVDLPLIKDLPAAVVQCVPPSMPAWHATWTNSMCYGVEMVNAGELRLLESNEGWAWWPDDYTAPWKAQGAVPKVPTPMYGRYWEPYTPEQVAAVVRVLREVQKLHRSIHKHLVLGHEQVTSHKMDPGPTFPIHGVRLAIYENIQPSAYRWFKEFSEDLLYGKSWRDALVREWCSGMSGYSQAGIDQAWTLFRGELQNFPKEKGFGQLGRLVLKLLGYFTSSTSDPDPTAEEAHSVEVFQHMMGLKVDGIPGAVTKDHLVIRLEDRGILP